MDGPSLPGLYNQPVFGWVAGVHLDRVGQDLPMVFDGATGAASVDGLAALWLALPESAEVDLDIVNLFAPGEGESITFPQGGFDVTDCLIGGVPTNLARYIVERGIDTTLPLVADYAGAMINVSFQTVDAKSGSVRFYAPVMFITRVADRSQRRTDERFAIRGGRPARWQGQNALRVRQMTARSL